MDPVIANAPTFSPRVATDVAMDRMIIRRLGLTGGSRVGNSASRRAFYRAVAGPEANALRAILHVDMDAFYASIEQHDRPELRGRPVIVGGGSTRGVVAAASYEVRQFGVHSAMPTREALRRCPDAVLVTPRMTRYREASSEVFAVFEEYTPLIEGLSLDEAFLDVTGSRSLFGSAEQIAAGIKVRIRERTGLTASVGVAHNKLLAKIASDLRKPDGLCVVLPTEVTALLDPMPIRRLAGIGAKTAERLEAAGISTLAQLRSAPDSMLWPVFGRYTRRVRERAAGIDDRPVVPDASEKQISAEETFAEDIRQRTSLTAELARLTDRVGERLRLKQFMARSVTIKVRRGDFTTFTRSLSFSPPTQDTGTLLAVARQLLDAWLAEQPRAAVRLLGVGVGGLSPASQLDLFAGGAGSDGTPHADIRTTARIDPMLDAIREKFGSAALTRASSLERPPTPTNPRPSRRS
jgi:DNA polymerase-4